MRVVLYIIVVTTLVTNNISYGQDCDQFYTTKSGDTLSSIAYRYYGDRQKWEVIKTANSDNFSIQETAMPIDLQLYIPCINEINNPQSILPENDYDESLLDQLLGNGITNKKSNAKKIGQETDNPQSNKNDENSGTLNSDALNELEKLPAEELNNNTSSIENTQIREESVLEPPKFDIQQTAEDAQSDDDSEMLTTEFTATEVSTVKTSLYSPTNIDQVENNAPMTDATAIQINLLKNDLAAIQEQARVEIEAMKLKMQELQQELEEAQKSTVVDVEQQAQESIVDVEQQVQESIGDVEQQAQESTVDVEQQVQESTVDVEQHAEVISITSTTSLAKLRTHESHSTQLKNQGAQRKASDSDPCEKFPNLCKYFQ